MNPVFLRQELERFLLEDFGRVDIDTRPMKPVKAKIIAEECGVMCGGEFLIRMLEMLSRSPDQVVVDYLVPEGDWFYGTYEVAVLRIHPEILRHGIRTGLNLIQTLSGIAINTHALVTMVSGTGCTLLDTRKTTPGFRAFEKYAVRIGGGRNHRFNREDGVIIKKEDIILDGGIRSAVKKAVRHSAQLVGIEVEVESLAQLDEAIGLPQVTHIMLDNMDVETVRLAVRLVAGRKILEASGVTRENIRDYAETGVPFISTSALIRDAHPVKLKMRIVSE